MPSPCCSLVAAASGARSVCTPAKAHLFQPATHPVYPWTGVFFGLPFTQGRPAGLPHPGGASRDTRSCIGAACRGFCAWKSPNTSTCFRGSAPARPRPSPRRRCGVWSERAALLPRPCACNPGRLPTDASRLSTMNECCLCGAGVWGAQGSRDASVESRGGAANGACHHRAPRRRRGAGGRLQSMPAVCGWHRVVRGTARRCGGAVPIKPELYSHPHTSAVALAAGPC